MEFYERFQQLLEENGGTIADLSRATSIPYTTLDGIVKKKSKNIKIENVFKIAEYFNVSMEYLATGNEASKATSIRLTEDEQHLITLWRQLSRDEQMKEIGRIEKTLEQ